MNEEISKYQSKEVNETIDSIGKLTKLTYKALLAQKPPRSVVKHHKYGDFDYIPITVVERLLDGLFETWSAEIIREGSLANGFYVVIRLRATMAGGEFSLVSDGIGFAELQTLKGAAPTDFTKLMPGAGVLAVPRAKAEAIKNAAKSFGNIFGRNLTRKDDNEIAEAQLVNASRSKIATTLASAEEKSDD